MSAPCSRSISIRSPPRSARPIVPSSCTRQWFQVALAPRSPPSCRLLPSTIWTCPSSVSARPLRQYQLRRLLKPPTYRTRRPCWQRSNVSPCTVRWYHTYGMRKTTVYLEEDEADGLRRLAREIGKPQAELIREAIGRLLNEGPNRTFHSMGKGHSGGMSNRRW